MIKITIFAIVLACCTLTAVGQQAYFQCANPDGSTFYRKGGCPARGIGSAIVVGPDGSVAPGLVQGPVQQQQITQDQACALAQQKLLRSEDMASRSGRPLPADFARRLHENVRQMCGG